MTFSIGTPFSKGAGYYYNWEQRGKSEADVQTCPHCQAVILMQEWRKIAHGKMAGGYCMRCNKPVCDQCNKKMISEGCIPFIAKLEKEFDMTVKLSQFLKDAGMEPAAPHRPFTGLVKE